MSRSAAVLFVLLAFAPGCSGWDSSLDTKDGLVSADLNPDGIIFIVPGVSRGIIGGRWLKAGLLDAGCRHAVVVYAWSSGRLAVYRDTTDVERNREQAATLARMIEEYRAACPGGTIQVVGISGGAAIATWAIEELPADVTVHRLFLMCPALSPGYDLTRALRHVERDVPVFVSVHDHLVLGFGTWFLGTLDRVHARAAGRVGFRLPDRASEETRTLYRKIARIDWSPEMLLDGNYGGHVGWIAPWYLRSRIVPMLVDEGMDFGF